MFKTIFRFLVITLIAIALGFGVYYLFQPSSAATFGSGFRDYGGERGFREGGFNLIGGLFGITGNLILVAIITMIVVSIQKLFSRNPVPVRTR
jgi:Na+/H+-dicarboxylate symporter